MSNTGSGYAAGDFYGAAASVNQQQGGQPANYDVPRHNFAGYEPPLYNITSSQDLSGFDLTSLLPNPEPAHQQQAQPLAAQYNQLQPDFDFEQWFSNGQLLPFEPVQQQPDLQPVEPVIQPVARKPTRDLVKERTRIYTGLIPNRQELEKRRSELQALNNVDIQRDGSLDADYPKEGSAQERKCHEDLFKAITDFSNIVEEEKHFQMKRVRMLSDMEVEIIAWDLLIAVRNAHCGKLGFEARAWNREWSHDSYDTFTARFSDVLKVCRISKSIVYGDCPVSFTKRIASAPLKELGSKNGNQKLNGKRKLQLEAGAEVIKTGKKMQKKASDLQNPTPAPMVQFDPTAATAIQPSYSNPQNSVRIPPAQLEPAQAAPAAEPSLSAFSSLLEGFYEGANYYDGYEFVALDPESEPEGNDDDDGDASN
ncbi:hypothetical protein QBC34DRAFT_383648 [Podospora aff. communis PSN243]|uniref:Uncharacterized protein n=1 Tax=Podospora aff. communis PSN243 TaxID=3040156 RepID=A0AAV9GBZ8_9PEZI|nr:hypothetical protein QBC34DRAFT_383648 [Podospora aff. communis PSN243]